ncbi:hypothetical protein SO802_024064 [Lithocarpus litseifolius]|uniref:Uncharacterized protein n=1 Tax=Lithocarpus litseifolius TaxID=425828 RepID=A0AAW2C967_9ROSI
MKLFYKLLEYFKVKGQEQEVWRQMCSSYSNYHDSLKKKWFKPYGEATEEAQANVPPGLKKDDWNCLVDLWSKQDYQMFVEVFGPERHGRVCGYGAGVTSTKLWGSSSSRMYDLEK